MMNDHEYVMTFTIPMDEVMDEDDLRRQKTFSTDNGYHLSTLKKAKKVD